MLGLQEADQFVSCCNSAALCLVMLPLHPQQSSINSSHKTVVYRKKPGSFVLPLVAPVLPGRSDKVCALCGGSGIWFPAVGVDFM